MKSEYCAFVLVFASMVMIVHGCTIWKNVTRHAKGEEPDEKKVFYSEVVVFGKVMKLSKSDRRGIKNAEIEVICSYKGDVQAKTIHVTGIGNKKQEMPGCPSVQLNESAKAALFLKRLPARRGVPWFEIEFAPLTGDVGIYLDDLMIVCDLTLTLGEEDAECFEPVGQDYCERYQPTTTPAPPTTPAPDNTVTKGNTVVVGPPVDESTEAGNNGPDNNNNNNNNNNSGEDTYETKTVKPKPAKSSGGDGKTGGSVGDENGCSRQTSLSILALLMSLTVAAFV